MNLNHLKAFVKVVQTKSYQEAGRLLNVSQPAITLRIKSLEDHFQTKLFKRTGDGIALTPQGEMIYKECISLLDRWEQLELSFQSKEPKGKLILGASTIPSEYFLPSFLIEFRKKYQDVRFSMKVSGTREVVSWLMNRKVDVIFTGMPENIESVESVPIYNDNIKVIIPPRSTSIPASLEDLLAYDWIIRESHSNTRQVWEEALKKNGYNIEQLTVVAEMGSTEAVIAAVEAGLGVSVVSSLAADRVEKWERVKVVDIPDLHMQRTFYLSYLQENKKLPLIQAILSQMTTIIESES